MQKTVHHYWSAEKTHFRDANVAGEVELDTDKLTDV